MIVHTTTVKYKVQSGQYCNHSLQKSTPLTRCRFCTDLGKGLYTCVLYNEPLATLGGALIIKSESCLKKLGKVGTTPAIPLRDLVKASIEDYRMIFGTLTKEGIPVKIAQKMAQEEVLKCLNN